MIWASRHFQKGNPQNLLRPSDLMRILVPWRAFGDLATAQRLVPEHEAQLIREVQEQRDARLADIEDAYGPRWSRCHGCRPSWPRWMHWI